MEFTIAVLAQSGRGATGKLNKQHGFTVTLSNQWPDVAGAKGPAKGKIVNRFQKTRFTRGVRAGKYIQMRVRGKRTVADVPKRCDFKPGQPAHWNRRRKILQAGWADNERSAIIFFRFDQHGAVGVGQRHAHLFGGNRGKDIDQIAHIKADLEWLALVVDRD